MRLIKKLPTEKINGQSRTFAIYECSTCKEHFRYRTDIGANRSLCKKCSLKERSKSIIENARNRFAEEAGKIHNYKYDYSLVDYKCTKKNIKIICPEHGVFEQTPHSHKKGHGCIKCNPFSSFAAGQRFEEDSRKIHGDKYDYSLVKYKDGIKKVTIICPKHGEFLQSPAYHKCGNGCPSCARNGFDPAKAGTLYYLKITDGSTVVYKIGITNLCVKRRFRRNDREKIQVIETWKYPIGQDAYEKEQQILKLYAEFKYKGDDILTSNGNSELFTVDILGLDTEEEYDLS